MKLRHFGVYTSTKATRNTFWGKPLFAQAARIRKLVDLSSFCDKGGLHKWVGPEEPDAKQVLDVRYFIEQGPVTSKPEVQDVLRCC